MTHRVEGELYESITGKLSEIRRQLRQKGGYPFNPELTQDALQSIIEGRFGGHSASTATSQFKYDRTKDGCKLIEDVGFTPAIMIEKLKLVSFLRNGENSIAGETMAERAVELNANLGQKHAEFMLENQAAIPKEWRRKCLVFPGTKWYSSNDNLNLCVPCIATLGIGLWYPGWVSLVDCRWGDSNRLVCPCG